MLNAIRHSKITVFVWGFMACYLLNISVDVTSLFAENEKKHIYYNEQESIIELVFEKVLGFEDAIPENNTNDNEKNQTMKKGFATDKFVLPFFEIKTKLILFNSVKKNLYYSNNLLLKPFLEIHSPPPEV
jgi:hypothetical protein